MSVTDGFVGTFSHFTATAGSDISANAVVTSGTLIGVTHESVKSGEKYCAFLPQSVNVYNFTLTETAASTVSVGTPMYVDSSGKVTATAASNTLIGILWTAIAVGDTHADVALSLYTPFVSGLQPALPAITGNGGKVLAVNSGATGLEWKTEATS